MVTRRGFLENSASSLLAGIFGSGLTGRAVAANTGWRMPDEGGPHTATWMAFGPHADIWGNRLQQGARENLARIAEAIAGFEPVNMLVCERDYDIAHRMCGASVNLIVREIDDLWLRDTGPVFVKNSLGQLGGVDFNFNGWGNKQVHANDTEVAPFVATQSRAQVVTTELVLEGGGIEVDGEGSAIITASCVLNRNRNPGISKAACEAELKRVLGLQKIIWLPGIAGKDITDGHTDFYARFARPGVVLAHYDTDPDFYDHEVTLRHLDLLRQVTDAKGRKLEVIVIPGAGSIRPRYENDDFAAGYINFYLCNHAVIAPEFGDIKTDAYCRDVLRDVFPDREVIQINIDAIAAGGGGIHCTTQQQPS
ncbi:agmatine deiminase family protein [Laribacter hongkongensis]|uniref:agmatine deiminase family protein n=1 Tax=Laribacter hongkongensis TaxID=168471 RepID=UPI001EFE4FFD|nr:agmatine deiminase family protein [Laribacter hongkongensis]MCG9096201.1 agmatine deiminase family protein [Laribacter hongkongensis]MCG9125914.1 agmatine deiminase family protein [Laribacter hongkongensis]